MVYCFSVSWRYNTPAIILNKDIHINILKDVISYFKDKGYLINNLTSSPIKGGDGNIEYLCYINNSKIGNIDININELINKAFKE